MPYLLLFIGLINAGPEFKAKFVDFHVGLICVVVATSFFYVATLQLHLLVLGFVVALSQHFCHVFNVCLLSNLSRQSL